MGKNETLESTEDIEASNLAEIMVSGGTRTGFVREGEGGREGGRENERIQDTSLSRTPSV